VKRLYTEKETVLAERDSRHL